MLIDSARLQDYSMNTTPTNDILTRRCFNVRPMSATLAHYKPTLSLQCSLGEPSCKYMRAGQLFRDPRSNTISLLPNPNAQLRALVELSTDY